MTKRPVLARPYSLVTACVIGAAGASSAMTVMTARLFAPGEVVSPRPECDESRAEAELAGLQAFEHADHEYDQVVAREQAEPSNGDDAEIAWTSVRDRYRLFLAYPEAVARWPELAARAQDRAAKLDALVKNLAEMQQLEIQAQRLAELDAEHGLEGL